MPEITMTPPAIPAPGVSGHVANNPAPAPKPNAPAAPVKSTEVPGDDAKLTEWAGLQRRLRETTAKLTEANSKVSDFEKRLADLETLRPVADKAGAVDKLLKEGKLVDAAKAAGIELEQAFAQWVEESEGKAGTPAAPPKELTDLVDKYNALEARLKAADDAKTKDADDARTKAGEAQRAATLKGLTDKVTAEGSRWVRCAKEPAEASEHALGVATEKAAAIIKERAEAKGYDLANIAPEQAREIALSDDEATELFDLSLDAVEGHYKALADKFHVPEPKRAATVRPIGDYFRRREADPNRDSSTGGERKVAVTLDGQRGSLRGPKETETRGKLDAGAAKTKALASIRALSRTTA